MLVSAACAVGIIITIISAGPPPIQHHHCRPRQVSAVDLAHFSLSFNNNKNNNNPTISNAP